MVLVGLGEGNYALYPLPHKNIARFNENIIVESGYEEIFWKLNTYIAQFSRRLPYAKIKICCKFVSSKFITRKRK